MKNVLYFLAYQGISGVQFFELLCAFFFYNKKGCNMFTLWGPNKSCGKSTLVAAIQNFVGHGNQCQLRFNQHSNQFWGAPLKYAAVAFCDDLEDFDEICGKEHFFDGIMDQPIESKGKKVEMVRIPPIIITSNYKPNVTFLEERMMHLVINNVLSEDRSYQWPYHTEVYDPGMITTNDIEPPTAADIQAFLIVGLLIRDLDYLCKKGPKEKGFPWKNNLPLHNRCQQRLWKDDLESLKLLREIYGFNLGKEISTSGQAHNCKKAVRSFSTGHAFCVSFLDATKTQIYDLKEAVYVNISFCRKGCKKDLIREQCIPLATSITEDLL